jgi:hypothetical protein
MQTIESPPQVLTLPPTRFRENEARGARIARPLRRRGYVSGHVDEALMQQIGEALMQRDEPAAALAHAIKMRAGEPGRVTQQQLRLALEEGIDSVSDAPPVLVDFIELVSEVPDWVDQELVDRGALVMQGMGANARDVLEHLALVGGYRFGGPGDLLVATGGLTGRRALRRLAETQHWTVDIAVPGALRPGNGGWKMTVHVRMMHAIVNAMYEERWDVDRWGLPINQADQAGTLGLFSSTLVVGCRGLGMPISREDAHAVMHMWKYVGWLQGVDDRFLTDDEYEAHRISYHLVLAAPNVSEAGPQLAHSIYEAVGRRHFKGWPERLLGLRSRYERERFLSMMSAFVGRAGMSDLDLSWRPSWAPATAFVRNTLRYRVVDRMLPGGKRRRERLGREKALELVDSYFEGEKAEVGALP